MQEGTGARLLFKILFRLPQAVFFLFFVALSDRFFFLFFVLVFGDGDELNRMDLSYFKLGIAFRAAKYFAFFDFILVEIDLGVAFRASDHWKFSFERESISSAYYITPVSNISAGEFS
jgi:hypothetical protein